MAILAGQLLTASALNGLVGLTTRLDADTSAVNNSTALVSTGLSLPLAANTVYRLDCFIIYDTSTAADYKYSLSLPAAATLGRSQWGFSTAATAADSTMFRDYVASGVPDSSGGVGIGTFLAMRTVLFVRTVGTAGNAVWQFAQNTATAVNTVTKKDSHIIAFIV